MKKTTPNSGYGNIVPPLPEHVKIYFIQKGLSEKEGDTFFKHFKCLEWKTDSGVPVRNWKALANEWIWNLQH